MSRNHIVFAALIPILVSTFSVAQGINSEATAISKKKYEDNDLIQEAGCEKDGLLLAKGACIESNYYKDDPPHRNTKIRHTFFSYRILEIKEKEKNVRFNVVLLTIWNDNRIKTNFSTLPENLIDGTNFPVLVPWYKIEKQLPIWRPMHNQFDDIVTEKIMYQPATAAMIGNDLTSNETTLLIVEEFQLNKFCAFDFARFPMDTQQFEILLHNQYAEELQLSLHDPQSRYHKRNTYELLGYHVTTTIKTGEMKERDNASYVGVGIQLRRIYRPFILQYYLPCIGIVLVSQVSFIIPPFSIPGRVGLVSTQFLTLTNVFISEMVSYFNIK